MTRCVCYSLGDETRHALESREFKRFFGGNTQNTNEIEWIPYQKVSLLKSWRPKKHRSNETERDCKASILLSEKDEDKACRNRVFTNCEERCSGLRVLKLNLFQFSHFRSEEEKFIFMFDLIWFTCDFDSLWFFSFLTSVYSIVFLLLFSTP